MSHPNKKRPEDRRSVRHMLLLTEREHARYKRKAAAAGVGINEWIRRQIAEAGEVKRLPLEGSVGG